MVAVPASSAAMLCAPAPAEFARMFVGLRDQGTADLAAACSQVFQLLQPLYQPAQHLQLFAMPHSGPIPGLALTPQIAFRTCGRDHIERMCEQVTQILPATCTAVYSTVVIPRMQCPPGFNCTGAGTSPLLCSALAPPALLGESPGAVGGQRCGTVHV